MDGKIPACKWVRLACQRQLDDLARDSALFPYDFDIEKAERVCYFIEQCPNIEGAKAGTLLKLEAWQCFILTTVFGWVHRYDDPVKGIKAGKRRFRKSYVEVPRKNGKSTLSAGVLLYGTFMDDEPGAQSYSLATSVEQAQAVYRPAKLMVGKMDEFRARFGVSVAALRINQESTHSFIRALPFKTKGGLDSLNPHIAVVDELHAHRTREVYEAIESGMGGRDQSLLWTITTAGFDQAGICFEKHNYLMSILEGKHEDNQFFGVIYTIDESDDWQEERTWVKANPNWNVSVSPVYVSGLASQAVQLTSAQNEFLTKQLCQWVNADIAWMDMVSWKACITTMNEEDYKADEVVIGSDLASRLDLAARMRVYRKQEDDGAFHFYAFGKYWLPEEVIKASDNSQFEGWVKSGYLEKVEGEANDFDLIEEDMMQAINETNIKEIVHDPWQAHHMVTHLQQALGEEKVIEMPANARDPFDQAMKELDALVREGRFHHNGDPVLSWAMSCVVSHADERGRIYPRKANKQHKIDPVIALLFAIYRWTAYDDEGEPSITFV